MIRDTAATDRPVQKPGWLSGRRLGALVMGALLLAAAVAVYPVARGWAKADRSVSMTRLRMAMVGRGDLERSFGVQGRIVAAQRPTLFSPAAGTVSLLVRAGDPVKIGDLLAQVDSPELENRLQQEESVLLAAESEQGRKRIEARQKKLASRQAIDLLEVQLLAAERARVRAEESRKAGIVNAVEYEKAQDDHRIKELELAHARQKAALEEDDLAFEVRNQELLVERQKLVVEDVRRMVEELTVRSPVNGQVSRLDREEQDAVTQGQPLMGVVDLSNFEVEIEVPESLADEIEFGTPAVIRYNNEELPGQVKVMSPEVEGNIVRGAVAFAEAPPAGVKQNQRVSVRLVLESRLDVLKVDRGPFLEDGGGRRAYVMDGDLAVRREIEIGAVSVNEVEIVSGLFEGEQVIISDTERFEGAETVLVRR